MEYNKVLHAHDQVTIPACAVTLRFGEETQNVVKVPMRRSSSDERGETMADDEARERGLSGVERWAVIGLLGGFVIFVIVLVVLRDNPNWDRLVYVFASYEALAFAGAGALFGVEVKRREVDAARTEASDQRNRADEFQLHANAGRALRAAVETKLAERSTETRRGARPGESPAPGQAEADLAELAGLAARLFERPTST